MFGGGPMLLLYGIWGRLKHNRYILNILSTNHSDETQHTARTQMWHMWRCISMLSYPTPNIVNEWKKKWWIIPIDWLNCWATIQFSLGGIPWLSYRNYQIVAHHLCWTNTPRIHSTRVLQGIPSWQNSNNKWKKNWIDGQEKRRWFSRYKEGCSYLALCSQIPYAHCFIERSWCEYTARWWKPDAINCPFVSLIMIMI